MYCVDNAYIKNDKMYAHSTHTYLSSKVTDNSYGELIRCSLPAVHSIMALHLLGRFAWEKTSTQKVREAIIAH